MSYIRSWAFRRKTVRGCWAAYGKLHHGWKREYASFITEYVESEQAWKDECEELYRTLRTYYPEECRAGGLHRHRRKYFLCRAFLGSRVMANYFGHRMFLHGWRYNRKIVTNGRIRFVCRKLNSPEAVNLCNSKTASAERWQRWYGRGWLAVGGGQRVSREQVENLLNGKNRLILKPVDDYGGHGIRVLGLNTEREIPETAEELNGLDKPFILEEYVEQTGLLHELNPSSLNTVRVVSAKHRDGSVSFENIFLRVGRPGSPVDNVTSGGSEFLVNPENGEISYGEDFCGRVYTALPDTGREVAGLKLPRFQEVLALCREAHLHAPDGLRIAGWDVCVSDTGVSLIEVNATPGFASSPDRRANPWKRLRRLLDEYAG